MRTVVVVGAGCAGTLTAAQLLRRARGPVRVLLVDRSATFGPGVAYSTPEPGHVLNVPAERMSAFPEEPAHFADWAASRLGPLEPGSYLPRSAYGAYLGDVLAATEAAAPAGSVMERVAATVTDVAPVPGGAEVRLDDGRVLGCCAVVLALGPLPAAAPTALPDDPRVVRDPWAPRALADAADGETSLVLGTGLTGLDVAFSLCDAGQGARVLAVSRTGLLPCAQLPGLRAPVPPPPVAEAPETAQELADWLQEHAEAKRAEGHDWREVVDGVRPHVAELWGRMALDERRRFVGTYARAWDRRRHRMPPAVAARVEALRSAGRLLVRAGRVLGVRALPESLEVLVAPAADGGDDDVRTLRVARLVLCTGPGLDVDRAPGPLLGALLERGVVRPDPLAIGIEATPAGRVLDARGAPQPWLHVLGALRRGELWESTAVGEIRGQAAAVAEDLAGRFAAQAAADVVARS